MIAKGSRGATLSARDAIAVAPAVGLFLGLAAYEIVLHRTWVGDVGDEAAYFLMSKNIWRYGAPLLDQDGSAQWSTTWSPGLSALLGPFGALPMGPSVVVERIVVALSGVAFLVLGYVWMRRQLDLSPVWAGAATACVAANYALVRAGALVLSDVPAAAALMGGVVLLRSGRSRAGLALLVGAAVLRPINIAVLGAALAWLVLEHRRRPTRAAAIAAVAGAGVVLTILLAAGGLRGYYSQFTRPGDGGISRTLVEQSKALTWYPLGWFKGDAFSNPHGVERALLKLVSLGLLVLAAMVAVRRRLLLEAMIVAATMVVLLVYRAGGADEARYLIPLSPFFIGAILAGFRELPWPSAASAVAALAACAAVVGGIHFYAAVTPSTARVTAEVSARRGAYRWVKEHVPKGSEVVAYNDLQAFLYSHHPTATAIRHFSPGHTFVVLVPPGLEAGESEHILDGFRGHEVYRRREVSVVQVDARTAPAG